MVDKGGPALGGGPGWGSRKTGKRGGAEVGLSEREEGGCSLDLLCVRIIKKEGRKKPQKTGETFLEQQTDSLPSLLERYFQIPCD